MRRKDFINSPPDNLPPHRTTEFGDSLSLASSKDRIEICDRSIGEKHRSVLRRTWPRIHAPVAGCTESVRDVFNE
jgi:hypothetical protein